MLKIVYTTLSEEAGPAWPRLLITSFLNRQKLFKTSPWAKNPGLKAEAAYVNQFCLAASLYLNLCNRFPKKKAFSIMARIIVPIGCNTVQKRLASLNLKHTQGMGKLMAFNRHMQTSDEARFNQRQYIQTSDEVCHYVIKRCVVFDFYNSIGTPELTRLICQVDNIFYPKAFSEFTFDRNGDWENTIAFGKPQCDFRLQLKSRPDNNMV